MQEQEIIVRIKQRYDTSANWTQQNPVLLAGELGIESDTNRIKIGNGTSAWNSLTYVSGGGGTGGSVIVDTTLSFESSNPIANSVVTQNINTINNRVQYLEDTKVENELDFILNGTYITQDDYDSIINGTYTLDSDSDNTESTGDDT